MIKKVDEMIKTVDRNEDGKITFWEIRCFNNELENGIIYPFSG